MSGLTREELGSLVDIAVAKAMSVKPADLECPGCNAKFDTAPAYLNHVAAEYMDKSLEGLKSQLEGLKIPTSEEFLTECKDGLCKIIEETYDVTKKGETPAAPVEAVAVGLFDHHKDEPEEA